MFDRNLVCAPVPESPHTRRGTGVLGDVAVCLHTRRRPLGRRQTRQHAALLVISVPCTCSPEPWAHENSPRVSQNIHILIILFPPERVCTYIYCVQSVYTDVMKFSVWTAAWARPWGGGAMESVWSFLMSLRSDVIWVCTASCLWTRSHFAATETTHTLLDQGKEIIKCTKMWLVFSFSDRTVTVMFAGPWHGCPPFPLHSRAMVTCSGWFLYSRGRLSSSSCSIATCWASRATAILTTRWTSNS